MPLIIRISDLIENDFDVDEEPVIFSQLLSSSAGVIEQYSDEFAIVRFDTGFSGQVDLSYEIRDAGGLADEAGIEALVAPAYDGIQTGTDLRDLMIGNALDEQISGGLGDDDIFGEAGADVLSGGEGDDLIMGGDGDDVIIGGDGADEIDGGDGHDAVSFEGSNVGVRADLSSRLGQGGHAQGDTYDNVEELRGSAYGISSMALRMQTLCAVRRAMTCFLATQAMTLLWVVWVTIRSKVGLERMC